MIPETERLIHSDAPTPAQLRRLARIGFGHAVSRNKLRSAKSLELKHYFADDLYGDFDENEEGLVSVNRRIAMRFGLVASLQDEASTAHLHYFDTQRTYSVFGESSPPLQTVYKFEWSRGKVLLAERTLRLLGGDTVEPRSLDLYLDAVSIPDDIASVLEAEDAFRAVSEKDCAILIDEASAYFSRIKDRETV